MKNNTTKQQAAKLDKLMSSFRDKIAEIVGDRYEVSRGFFMGFSASGITATPEHVSVRLKKEHQSPYPSRKDFDSIEETNRARQAWRAAEQDKALVVASILKRKRLNARRDGMTVYILPPKK